MSEQPRERKNRFQISREVQEEFVNGIAETMLSLAEKAGDWQRGLDLRHACGNAVLSRDRQRVQRGEPGSAAADNHCQGIRR